MDQNIILWLQKSKDKWLDCCLWATWIGRSYSKFRIIQNELWNPYVKETLQLYFQPILKARKHQPLPRFRVRNSPSVLLHLNLQVTPWIMDVGTLLSFKVEEIFYQKVNNMHKTRISYTKKPGFKLGPRDYWATVSYSTPCLARAHCSSCLHLVHTWCTAGWSGPCYQGLL